MFASVGQLRQRIAAPTRRGFTYCGARLEHGGGRDQFPS